MLVNKTCQRQQQQRQDEDPAKGSGLPICIHPVVLWMVAKSISHHLKNPGRIRFPGKYQQTMVSHGFKVVQDFVHPQYFHLPISVEVAISMAVEQTLLCESPMDGAKFRFSNAKGDPGSVDGVSGNPPPAHAPPPPNL